jgi:hypothetical protein
MRRYREGGGEDEEKTELGGRQGLQGRKGGEGSGGKNRWSPEERRQETQGRDKQGEAIRRECVERKAEGTVGKGEI